MRWRRDKLAKRRLPTALRIRPYVCVRSSRWSGDQWQPRREQRPLLNHTYVPNCEAIDRGDRLLIDTLIAIQPGDNLSFDCGLGVDGRITEEIDGVTKTAVMRSIPDTTVGRPSSTFPLDGAKLQQFDLVMSQAGANTTDLAIVKRVFTTRNGQLRLPIAAAQQSRITIVLRAIPQTGGSVPDARTTADYASCAARLFRIKAFGTTTPRIVGDRCSSTSNPKCSKNGCAVRLTSEVSISMH
jgi:hypothetical protein